MKGLAGVLGAALSALVLVGQAAATAHVSSLDTCTVTGSGSTYTLHISVGSGIQQFGFAFGAGGARISNAVIPGSNGSFSTQKLAASTTGAWVSDTPLSGAVVATLTVSGTPGTFKVVPSGAAQASYFDPVTCSATNSAPVRSASLTVAPHATYSSAAGAWHLAVNVPGPGTLSAVQLEATVGTAGSKPHTTKALVQTRSIVAHSGGKYTLTLRATSKGLAALKASGAMKVALHVTFDAQSGKAGTKTVNLTLRR